MREMLKDAQDLSLRDRILALRALDPVSQLDDASLTLLAEHARYRAFKKGERPLTEGQLPASLFVVLEGKVRVERQGALVAMIEDQGGFGFVSTLARDELGVTATVLEDTVCLEIPAGAYLRALEEDFELIRNGLRISASQLIRNRGDLPADPKTAKTAVAGEYLERELTMVERIIELRNGPVFSRCNLDAVIELVRRSREVRYEEGAEIFARGEPSTFSFGIDYGIVRCTATSGEFVEVGCGFAMGVMDSFAQNLRSFSAVARTKVVGYRIDVAVFMSVLETHFELALDLQAVISRSLIARAK